jgi:hypothetical protein
MILVRRLIDLDWFEFLLKPVCLQHRSILKKNQHYWKIFEFFSVVDDFFSKSAYCVHGRGHWIHGRGLL